MPPSQRTDKARPSRGAPAAVVGQEDGSNDEASIDGGNSGRVPAAAAEKADSSRTGLTVCQLQRGVTREEIRENPSATNRAGSTTSSMAVSGRTLSVTTQSPDSTPSLSHNSGETVESGSVIISQEGTGSRGGQSTANSSHDLWMLFQSPGTLYCCYTWLPCKEKFDSREDWETHVKSHFYDKSHPQLAGPPKRIFCPFQDCSEEFEGVSGEQAWQRLILHTRTNHGGIKHAIDRYRRPNHSLIDHFYNIRVITAAQRKHFKGPDPWGLQPGYLRSAGTLRDQRASRPPKSTLAGQGV